MDQEYRGLSQSGGLGKDYEGTIMQSLRRGEELAGCGNEDLGGGKPRIKLRVVLGHHPGGSVG